MNSLQKVDNVYEVKRQRGLTNDFKRIKNKNKFR